MHQSTHALLRRAAVGVATLAALPLVAAPAFAAQLSVTDARGDMWIIEEGTTSPSPAPGASIGDIVRTTFRHTDSKVVVRARFVELQPTGKRFRMWVDMRDQDGRKTYAAVDSTRRNRDGRSWLMSNRGVDIECTVRHSIDYERNTVRVAFPRRCLDNPRYLQFRAMSEHVRGDWSWAYLDNALSAKAPNQAWSDKVRKG